MTYSDSIRNASEGDQTDGVDSARSRIADAEEMLNLAYQRQETAELGVAEARVGIIGARVQELYPDTRTVILTVDPRSVNGVLSPCAFLDENDEPLWQFDRDHSIDPMSDDEWVLYGEVVRQMQEINSSGLVNSCAPLEVRTKLATRVKELGLSPYAAPRMLRIG